MESLLKLVLLTITSFVALFIISKLSGKKQIAQLEFIDYVIGISIGSIAAEMTFDTETPFYYFLIAMLLFFLLDYAITYLSRKAVFLKKLFIGRPLILIEQGKINYKNLKKSRLDTNELLSLCRVEGYFDLADVYYCLLEINGQISILPSNPATPVALKDITDMTRPLKQPSLSVDIIIDGKIIENALMQSGKGKVWLLERLNVTNEKELRNIILATYNINTDEIDVHLKNIS